jgi:hypothetical protein
VVEVRRVVACSAVGFSIVLAVIVGNRMSAEAMAVVVGVICGVAASIPTSVLVLALSRRGRPGAQTEAAPQASPPVFLVTPTPVARPGAAWPGYCQPYAPPAMPVHREYRIIGEEPF